MFRRFNRLPALASQSRQFRTSAFLNVKVGDKIPLVTVLEGSISGNVNIAEEVAHGRNLIVTVPGAFSSGCSQRHVPGYRDLWEKFEDKGVQHIFILAENDVFVMNAWKESFGNTKGLRFLADPSGKLAKALELEFDASKFFGNNRYKRAAILVVDGVVKDVVVEPDSTGIDLTEADKILGTL